MRLRDYLQIIWALLWWQPFFTCPVCDGAGGAMEGYYEPEWSECSSCWHYWETLDDYGIERFNGRLSLFQLWRVKLAKKLGVEEAFPFREIVRCLTGHHNWLNEEVEPGLRICGWCWASETRRQEHNEV